MWKIDIFKRKSDGNRGKYITSSYYPDEASANKAYELLKSISRRGLMMAPRDAEVLLHDEEKRKQNLKKQRDIRIWSVDYNENGYNPETKEDKRYTWKYEPIEPSKLSENSIVVPEFVSCKTLSQIIVTKPKLV